MRGPILAGAVLLVGLSLSARPAAGQAPSPPSYSGGLLSRSTLTGDWVGTRNVWAEHGITFDASVTQVTQGVVNGGKDASWVYGGRGVVTGLLDTQKAGLWPGGFLTVELEGNWNDSVNGSTGALMPANTNQIFPVPVGNNVALPNVSFAQFLSHYGGVTFGKFDSITSADNNEFAHGKGDTQFLNLAFSINPVVLAIPYSTLGAGVIGLPTKDPNQAIVSFLVLSADGKATTDGFDDLSSDNLVFALGGRMRTDFFDLTGHHALGAFYSNAEYNSVDERLDFVIENRALVNKRDTWAVFYNFDQFLYETDKDAGHGVGLFGRFGASEGNPNPARYVFSIGAGGKGMLPGREHDRFGIGYYYIDVNNPTFQRPLMTRAFLRDEWGIEIFYNFAITPWMLLTPDLQIIAGSQRQRVTGRIVEREFIGTGTILGLRLQVVI
jgi:porin